MSEVHPYECPNCGEAIRATNIEYLYEEYDHVVPHQLIDASTIFQSDNYEPTKSRKQLFICPNDDCRIVRLLPGDSDE